MVTPLDGAASPHPRRRRYLRDARQGRGECAVRGALRQPRPMCEEGGNARQGVGPGRCPRVRPATPPPFQATLCGGAGRVLETGGKTGRRGGGGMGRVLPAASALAKLWKGELAPPLSSSAATDCCPIILVRLLVGDSKTSMRLGEHVGSIGDDISASNPRSRGRFWHASIEPASCCIASRARLGSLESRTGSFIETRCHRERGEERERE